MITNEVIFIDDGDNTTGILTECMDVARALRIVRQISPISGVIVRGSRSFSPAYMKGHITRAQQNGFNISFYNEERHGQMVDSLDLHCKRNL